MRSRQSSVAATARIFPCASSAARATGESAPPATMTTGASARAWRITFTETKTTRPTISGISSVGITIIETSVRRSRSMSRSSLP